MPGILNSMKNNMVIIRLCKLLAIPLLCLFSGLPPSLRARPFPLYEKGKIFNQRIIIYPGGAGVMHLCTRSDDRSDCLQINGDYHDCSSGIQSPASSANGMAVYDRRDSRGARSVVIVKGSLRSRVIPHGRDIRINRDGTDYIYVREEAGKKYFCSSTRQLGPFPEVRDHGFGPEGTLYGFLAIDKYYFVYIKDRAFGPFNTAWGPVFSQRGGRYAFSYEQEGKYFCRVDETTLGPFGERRDVIFSPDGSRHLVVSRDNRKSHLYLVLHALGPFQFIGPVAMSDDGSRLAFRCTGVDTGDACFNFGCAPILGLGRKAQYCCTGGCLNIFSRSPDYPESGSVWIQHNDRRFDGFDDAGNPLLDREGRSIVFRFEKKNKQYVRFNEKVYGPFNMVRDLDMDGSGKHLVFSYQTRWAKNLFRYGVHCNEREYDIAASPLRAGITRDGSSFCCLSGDEKAKYIMINGESRGPFDAAEFLIEGNRIFIAWVDGGRLFLEEAR